MKPMSDNVKKARKDMKWSQHDLATRLGVSRQTVLSWENGDTPVPSDKLIAISKLTGKQIQWFFEEKHDELLYM